ncbi:protein-methionine-sulfoxide reductase catalytic subunit MsrP [Thalassotalea sp. G20_0]|uniref:protein-methionine-sulfoxide reductase catalytic subunit MsrP n=1 Tax=Thalassotalea sp. G20_0 TaxID=2821093 RepID=UPI001ADD5BD1|nr:protein-methionine-sulfoxide reductase catalytic subunit MsrP [Thalassotalea sp. G20_0]MBO9496331.1 protein-methionine-sulfoxide reductase catalytic subunit MsrP [Thalassotalea sp. G20_0]
MLLKIKKRSDIGSSEITPEHIYHDRRRFMQQSGRFALAGLGLMLAGCSQEGEAKAISKKTQDDVLPFQPGPEWLKKQVIAFNPNVYTTTEALTPHQVVTTYNNFYEFGTGKGDPVRNAHSLKTDPWSVVVEGEVAKPGRYHLEDILKPHAMEERIYRLRCVEAWSMVIPWIGIPLANILKQFEPTSKARFVEFTTLHDPEQMPGQKASFGSLDWPYVEGLRIDEAMNPLTLMATGLYGDILPNQNGAPFRLVVPWKYGFKSIKSIVKIRLTEQQPKTTWETSAPQEYGFYANVNPAVDHPRWSQKHERRLPSTLLAPNRIETQPFNGYGEEVADLYKGMDLTRFY